MFNKFKSNLFFQPPFWWSRRETRPDTVTPLAGRADATCHGPRQEAIQVIVWWIQFANLSALAKGLSRYSTLELSRRNDHFHQVNELSFGLFVVVSE